MLDDFAYLWRARERPTGLRRWQKVWLKRLYHLPGLFRLLMRSMWLRRRGSVIGHLVVLGRSRIGGTLPYLTIGDDTALGRCDIALHDRVTIGRRVVINDGAIILTASHSLSRSDWAQKKGPVTIGDYAWIATNAILLPGVAVGRGAVVGAGAVVRSNVPDHAVVVGNPAAVQAIERTRQLQYSPIMLTAPFEAWVGRVVCEPLVGDVRCR